MIERFTRLVIRLSEPAFCWAVTDGLQRIKFDAPAQYGLADPAEILRHIQLIRKGRCP